MVGRLLLMGVVVTLKATAKGGVIGEGLRGFRDA